MKIVNVFIVNIIKKGMVFNMDNAKKYLGLTKKRAQDLAEADNLIFRLIRIDERNFFGYPDYFNGQNLCIEIEKSVVVKSTIM